MDSRKKRRQGKGVKKWREETEREINRDKDKKIPREEERGDK